MKKILIIEDDKKIRRYLELELVHWGYRVDFARDGEEGLEKSRDSSFDLILLDLMLPKISGEDLCEKIRKITSIPIIILSAKGETTNKIQLLDMGANDYLTKPFEIEELLARMRVALRGVKKDGNSNAVCLEYGEFRVDSEKKIIFFGGEPLILTKTEYSLLYYLMLNREIVLGREQILFNVWGMDYMGDEKIVDAYIKNLRKKIDPEYIKTVRGFGYTLKERRPE
ncbi:MAG: response regulator transcription factor [Fusobacteriaceae bacterium]